MPAPPIVFSTKIWLADNDSALVAATIRACSHLPPGTCLHGPSAKAGDAEAYIIKRLAAAAVISLDLDMADIWCLVAGISTRFATELSTAAPG